MGDGHQHSHGDYGYLQHLLPQRLDAGSSRRRVAGEIVEVQGGHIMRSTGRKDRHSKVCTAKGPRDRRVRLSAHTAIQFYDVQDRLGYDRPSKAVDWLIKNAKAAIDELAELPPWRPAARTMDTDAEASYRMFGSTGILPPSLDSDAIADTIKAFFPVSTAGTPEDLRLSLQSLPEQPLAGNFHQNEQLVDPSHHLVLDTTASGWPEQTIRIFPPATEIAGGSSSAGGYAFSFPPPIPQPSPQGVAQLVHQVGGQSASAAQRGPLQSSDPVPYQSWVGHQTLSAMGDARFASFHVPARIQDGEERDGISNFPPTASRGRPPAC